VLRAQRHRAHRRPHRTQQHRAHQLRTQLLAAVDLTAVAADIKAAVDMKAADENNL
jgi:hypothetical protein